MHALALVASLSLQLAADAAFAERAAPIAPVLDVTAAFPASDTTVPANGRLVFFGGAPGDLSFVRTRGDGTEDTLPFTTVPVDQLSSAHIVTLPEGLVVGEALVVSARCGSCFFSGTWTVGDDDTEAPVFDDGPSDVDVQPIGDGSLFGATRAYGVTIRLPGARDGQSPVGIELRSDVVDRFGPESFGPGAPISLFVDVLDPSARTLCFDAIAFDSAGNEGALADPVCAELVPAGSGGCAQASPSTSWLVLAFLLTLAVLTARSRKRAPVVALFLVTAHAHAAPALEAADQEALVALPQVDFGTAIPADGSTLPTNGRLLVFGPFFDDASNDGGNEATNGRDSVVFERFLGLDKTTLAVEVLPGSTPFESAFLVDLGELVPGELVQVGCSACFTNWTATVIDDVDESAPVFGVGNKNRIGVTDMGEGVGYQVRACIPRALDAAAAGAAESPIALRVVTDAGEAFTHALQGSCIAEELEVAVFADGGPRTFCWQTVAVDVAGNEALFHENVCTVLPEHTFQNEPAGCTQAPVSCAPLALALVLVRARRRGRR